MTTCRLCGLAEVERVLDLGHHPLADRFPTQQMLEEPEVQYPLVVGLCTRCGYAGLCHVVPEADRYRAGMYSYTSANSSASRGHFARLALIIKSCLDLGGGDLVVDVGGNDGTLLSAIAGLTGCRVLNVDPCSAIGASDSWTGREDDRPESMAELWGPRAARAVADRGGAALVAATNVLNHASDPVAFLSLVRDALRPDGTVVVEVPSLNELMRRRAVDTIYLEHVSYFDDHALRRALVAAGLEVQAIEPIEYMGGSLRAWARRVESASATTATVIQGTASEVRDPIAWRRLGEDFAARCDRLVERLHELRRAGRACVGVGAAAKGNTLLQCAGINRRLLACVADASPHKIGRFTPGTHLPIVDDEAALKGASDALLLAPNLGPLLRDKLGGRVRWVEAEVETEEVDRR